MRIVRMICRPRQRRVDPLNRMVSADFVIVQLEPLLLSESANLHSVDAADHLFRHVFATRRVEAPVIWGRRRRVAFDTSRDCVVCPAGMRKQVVGVWVVHKAWFGFPCLKFFRKLLLAVVTHTNAFFAYLIADCLLRAAWNQAHCALIRMARSVRCRTHR